MVSRTWRLLLFILAIVVLILASSVFLVAASTRSPNDGLLVLLVGFLVISLVLRPWRRSGSRTSHGRLEDPMGLGGR